jgi:putative ABC transport system permease protein
MVFDFLARNFSYAFRTLRKSAGFSLTAILTLTLGIGATTAMFSVLDGVLLRPLPFGHPERLVMIKERLPKLLPNPVSVPAGDVVTFGRETTSFDGIAGFIAKRFDLTGEGVPQRVSAARVEWNLFSVLGAQPAIGRTFIAQEDHPESYVAIVSYRFWKQQLGGTPAVLGKTVTLDRRPFQIIGVMPPEFTFPLVGDELADIWVPMGYTPSELKVGGSSFAFGALARLKPGVSMAQAQADVERVTSHIAQTNPAAQRGDLLILGAVVPLVEDAIGSYRKPLLVLFLAVIFVLLIAVVNVANLLLARGTARQRELAIRLALGARARQIVGQLLVESVVLSVIGGVAGCLLAMVATQTVVAMVPSHIPRLHAAAVDARVLLFALAVSVFAGIAFGAAPALFAMHTNVNDNLKEGGRGTSVGRHGQRLRAGFVVAQVALALMLLAGAGLLLRSFRRVIEVDPGFRPENVITASVSLSPTEYSQPAHINSFFKQLDDRLGQVPGAKAAGLSTDLPLETKLESALTVDGYTPPPGGSGINAFSFVMGDYFQALGIPLVRGRFFTPADDDPTQRVVIINQTLADKFFAGREPIGGRLKLGASGAKTPAPWATVVGVVGNVKSFGLDDDALPHTYMPYLQHAANELKGGTAQNLVLAVRTAGDPLSAASSIRTAVWSLDRQVPVTDMRAMEQVIAQSTAPRRFNMVLVGFFAAAALLLAAVGLYGVMSYSVSQRTHEIGVRMTLGASRADVLRMVLGGGLKLVLIGVAAGVAGALATSRLLASFLFEVRPSDPVTFAAVAVILTGIALLASTMPALRATRVDPMVALRNE